MVSIALRLHSAAAPAALILVAAGLASCAPAYGPPKEVSTSAPSVTYKYRSDQELLAATNKADAFCRQYGTLPQAVNMTDDPDGSKTVVFACTATSPATARAVPAEPVTPSVTYTYRSDQELVDATREADAYCLKYNARPQAANITSNPDGSRAVVFQCTRAL